MLRFNENGIPQQARTLDSLSQKFISISLISRSIHSPTQYNVFADRRNNCPLLIAGVAL